MADLKTNLKNKLRRMKKKGIETPHCMYCDKPIEPDDDFEYIVNGKERWMHTKCMNKELRAK